MWHPDRGAIVETSAAGSEGPAAPAPARPLALMARNQPLEWTCREWGEPAGWICTLCVDEGDGGWCEAHLERHPDGERGEPPPLVSTPRTGACGYTGPAEPPCV